MRAIDIPEIYQLSTPEKILLLEELWESITSDDAAVPVPDSHKQELDHRLERQLNVPDELLQLEQLQARIERRK